MTDRWSKDLLHALYVVNQLTVKEVASRIGEPYTSTFAAIKRLGLHRPLRKPRPKQARNWMYIVDEAFADEVCRFAWCKSRKGHLLRMEGKDRRIWMHLNVWFLAHGYWPKRGEIDHINRIPWDNRLENLRLATRSLQQQNRAHPNKTGLPQGVKHCAGRNLKRPYSTTIYHRGARRHLGYFTTPEEASAAYQAAKAELIQKEAARCSTDEPTRQA